MKDNRSIFSKKLAAVKHRYMWFRASKNLDIILVSEYPKSGGTWYCQMLSEYLQLPYPRNRTPKLERSVLHGHHYYHASFNKPVCMLRDGRDALVSYYHHMYFGNSILPQKVFEKCRAAAPFENFDNIRENMAAYIEHMFTAYRLSGHRFTWSDFVKSFYNKPHVLLIKYEDLLTNTAKILSDSIHNLTGESVIAERVNKVVEKYSFQALTKRKPGDEDKKEFLRKGIAGDWKNYFTQEACEIFNYYAGNELVMLGYEKNKNWY